MSGGAYTVDTLGGRSRPDDPAGRQARAWLQRTLDRPPPGQWASNHHAEAQAYTNLVYIAVRAKADALAAATIEVTRLRKPAARKAMVATAAHPRDEARVPVPESHPLARLFADPNERDTPGDLLADVATQLDLTGSALLYHPLNAAGKPCRLWCVPTALTTAAPPSPQYPGGAWRVNWLQYGGAAPLGWGFGNTAVLPADHCIQLQYRHPLNRWDGCSPVRAGDQIIDTQRATDASRKAALDTQFTPDAVVTLDGASEAEVRRVQALMDATYTGPHGRRVLVAAGEDVKAARTGTPPKELEFAATYDQINRLTMALFGVTATVAGVTEADSYAGFYAKLHQFYEGTLRHLAARLSAWLTKHLARPYWGPGYAVTVNVPAPTDPTRQDAMLAAAAGDGTMDLNEIRAARNQPPKPGGDVPTAVYLAQLQRQFAPPPTPPVTAGGLPENGPPRPGNPGGAGSLPPRPAKKAFPRRRLARYAARLVKAAGRSRLDPDADDEEPAMADVLDDYRGSKPVAEAGRRRGDSAPTPYTPSRPEGEANPFVGESPEDYDDPAWTITPASGHVYRFRFDPARRGSTVFARPTLTVQFWRHAKGSTKDNPTRVPDATYAYFFSDNAFGAEIARKMGDTLHPYGDVLYPLVIRAGVPYTRVGN